MSSFSPRVAIAALATCAVFTSWSASAEDDKYIFRLKPGVLAQEIQSLSLNARSFEPTYLDDIWNFDFSTLLTAEGIIPSDISWEISGSAMSWLLIDGNGKVEGTPTEAGTYELTVTASSGDVTGSQTYTLNVEADKPFEAVKIAAGYNHTCAITKAGGVACWGQNNRGQLGSGSNTPYNSLVPIQVPGLETGVTEIVASYYHTCVIQNGGAKCWGDNREGQLGNSNAGSIAYSPVQVSGMESGVASVSTSRNASCAVQNGAAKCWGDSNYHNVHSNTPVIIPGLEENVSELSIGQYSACAIQSGAAECFGRLYGGLMGDGTNYDDLPSGTVRYELSQVQGLSSGVTSIDVFITHSCANHYGFLKCWGRNDSGQIGDGTNNMAYSPVQVIGLTSDVFALSSSENYTPENIHTCSVGTSGALECWGMNLPGYAPGSNSYQAMVASGMAAGISAISIGYNHSCAIQEGTVVCWGSNSFGQLGDGTTTSSDVPVQTVEG